MRTLLLYRLFQVLGWPLFLLPLFFGKRRPLWHKKLRPPPVPPDKEVLWVHALSVGETRAAAPLLRALREELPQHELLFTVATVSGFDLAQRELSDLYDYLWSSPPDLYPVVKTFLRALSPRAFVLVETDIWPEMIWGLKAKGVPLFLANAALSERALRRLKRWPSLANLLYAPFKVIGAATKGDAERLKTLFPEREILYLGNLKFDVPLPRTEEAESLIRELAPLLKPPVIVCGSTHPGEEELWLEALKHLGQGSLVLCPRKIERAPEIAAQAEARGFRVALRRKPRPAQVLVVDTLGELRLLYALAEVAFVGGTLVPVGGHNLLEPALWGKPVLFGPYVESISDLAEELENAGGGKMVSPNPENLAQTVAELLPRAREFGMQAFMVAKRHRGAARRYARLIAENL